MDWNSLKTKALEFKDKAVTASIDAANKAVDFADKNMKNTALALKVWADYEKVKGEKILVILAGSVDNVEYKKLIAKMPLFLGYAWTANATLRTCDMKESPDVIANLEITGNPTLLVYKRGDQVVKTDNIDEINKTLSNLTQFIG